METIDSEMQCEHCRAWFPAQTKRRGAPRRFCSNRCRLAAHKLRAAQTAAQRMEWLRDHVSFEGDECLIWPFTRMSGYAGHITIDGHQQYACRVMCGLAHGPAPTPRHETAHSCGNGVEGCINPKHLPVGPHLPRTAWIESYIRSKERRWKLRIVVERKNLVKRSTFCEGLQTSPVISSAIQGSNGRSTA